MIKDINYYRKLAGSYNFNTEKEYKLSQISDNYNKNMANVITGFDILISTDRADVVKINGIEKRALIDYNSNFTLAKLENGQRTIKTYPNDMKTGDYVEIKNYTDADVYIKHIVIAKDPMRENYEQGYIKECNFTPKWIDEFNNIIERCCILEDKTLYTSGEKINKYLVQGDTDAIMTMPNDKNTIKLKTGDRFILGNNINQRKVYRITKTNDFEEGLLNIYLVEDKISDEYDNLTLGIANYYGKPTININILNELPLKVTQGLTVQLNHEIKVDGEVSNLPVVYSSNNTNVSIDNNGLITGNTLGNSTITVSLEDNPNIKSTINIEVVSLPISDNYSVKIIGSDSIPKTVTPKTYTANIYNNGELITDNSQSVTWSVSDNSKIQITYQDDKTIKIKGLAYEGTFILTAKLNSDITIKDDKTIILSTAN
jgi:hypothetical protein